VSTPISVVSIQAGRRDARTVFLVPGAGATVSVFLSLAECFGPETAVYGLQPRGLDGLHPPHTTVEEAAAEFVAAIRSISPRGPYRIAGHSFGGWIAHEIALRLTAMGETVHPLVILDSEPPGFLEKMPESMSPSEERLWVLLRLIKLLEMRAGRSFRLGRAELAPLDPKQQLDALGDAMKAAGMLSRATRISAVEHLLRSFAANLRTYYVPAATLIEDVVLVQPEDQAADPDSDAEQLDRAEREARWRMYVPHLRTTRVPGNHMTMLSSPNVISIGKLLRSLWSRAHCDSIIG
jgi:thioesterase domain-containing protein